MGNLRNGTYRIFALGEGIAPEAAILTATEQGVTLAGKGAVPEREQEFRVERAEGGYAIQFPAQIIPSASLSHKEPQSGDRLILGPLSDFPTRVWNIEPLPLGLLPEPFVIRVPDADLAVGIAPIKIFPPQLGLQTVGIGKPQTWAFEFLRE
ncbi:hypothetical protein ACIQU4_11510 [Streptomyces sp. NPDC090741]|uniref:hypothetical protein n=1 Tax=Streptomyces sp. NPDC090741 TaxID=3365967 RepID=UPI003813EB44